MTVDECRSNITVGSMRRSWCTDEYETDACHVPRLFYCPLIISVYT